ncbi:MAG: hypothetical protein PUD82_02800 [Coriobacteriaceae bacterium]|nr:hypothetical protein [Coriobacteriaceae bacterium]
MKRFSRKSMLASVVAVAAGASLLGLAGCSPATSMVVGVDKSAGTEIVVATLVFQADEFEGLLKKGLMESEGADFDEETFDEVVAKMRSGELLDGGSYYEEYDAYVFHSENTYDYAKVYDHTYAVYGNDILEISNTLFTEEFVAMFGDLDGAFDDASCDIIYSFDFNGRTPVATSSNLVKQPDGTYECEMTLNGAQLERIVTGWNVDYLSIEPVYACFSDAYKSTSSISLAGSSLTNSKEIGITTPGIIEKVVVDGNSTRPARDLIAVPETEGKHSLEVFLENGNSKKLNVTLDLTKPTVKIGKTAVKSKTTTVKKGSKISAKDDKGIKSIKLGGKTIRNGAKITKGGKLVVTDKAGNKVTTKVKVK